MKTVPLSRGRMPQLASIPKAKRQTAIQPTDNGTDEDSNERKPRQRKGSRSLHAATSWSIPYPKHTNALRCFKRLIPYSKQVSQSPPQYGEGSCGVSDEGSVKMNILGCSAIEVARGEALRNMAVRPINPNVWNRLAAVRSGGISRDLRRLTPDLLTREARRGRCAVG